MQTLAPEFHEAANIFPLDEAHLDELAADIKRSGLQVPIETLDGEIVDGRRRYLACQRAGVEPKYRAVKPADPIAYVVSINLHRRQLTATQRSTCAARVRELYDRQAKERQQVRKGKQAGATVENFPQLDSGKARDQVGKVFGVSGKSVDMATRVLKLGTPELVAAVDADLIAVSTASRLSSFSEAEQNAAVERATESAKNGHKPKRRPNAIIEKEDEDDDEESPAPKRKGVGVILANEALNFLTRIPKNDALRKRGFQIVTDWIRHNP